MLEHLYRSAADVAALIWKPPPLPIRDVAKVTLNGEVMVRGLDYEVNGGVIAFLRPFPGIAEIHYRKSHG